VAFTYKSLLSILLDTRSYIPPVQIGEVMRGAAIGQVLESKSSKFPAGTYATASVGWTELAVVKEKNLERVDVPDGGKVTDALGVLGTFPITVQGPDSGPDMGSVRQV
jgi:NADPH-dependent curcumin reductase CurA